MALERDGAELAGDRARPFAPAAAGCRVASMATTAAPVASAIHCMRTNAGGALLDDRDVRPAVGRVDDGKAPVGRHAVRADDGDEGAVRADRLDHAPRAASRVPRRATGSRAPSRRRATARPRAASTRASPRSTRRRRATRRSAPRRRPLQGRGAARARRRGARATARTAWDRRPSRPPPSASSRRRPRARRTRLPAAGARAPAFRGRRAARAARRPSARSTRGTPCRRPASAGRTGRRRSTRRPALRPARSSCRWPARPTGAAPDAARDRARRAAAGRPSATRRGRRTESGRGPTSPTSSGRRSRRRSRSARPRSVGPGADRRCAAGVLGVERIGDREDVDLRGVGLLVEQVRPVGRPPEAAGAEELLGRDELGEAVREALGAAVRHARRVASGDGHDVQVVAADERDARPVRRQARVNRRAVARGQLAGLAGRHVDEEDPARHGHERPRAVVGQLERGEPRCVHAHALAADPLLRREGLRRGEQRVRGHELSRAARRHVHREERLLGIARAGAKEDRRPAVRRQAHLDGQPEAEDREAEVVEQGEKPQAANAATASRTSDVRPGAGPQDWRLVPAAALGGGRRPGLRGPSPGGGRRAAGDRRRATGGGRQATGRWANFLATSRRSVARKLPRPKPHASGFDLKPLTLSLDLDLESLSLAFLL